MNTINRRRTQTVFFPPDDLSGGKPACPPGKQVLGGIQKKHVLIAP